MDMKTVVSNSEKETRELGKRLGRVLQRGDIIALCGEMGSGKTVLTKGIAEGLGVKRAEYVNSPSFVILKEYKGRLPLYHFDIYRLDSPSAFLTVDYTRYFYGDGVSVVEWADKITGLLPKEFLRIDLSVKEKNVRNIRIYPRGRRYKNLLERIC